MSGGVILLENISNGKTYKFRLTESITFSKNYNLVNTPNPEGTSNDTIILALMGMTGNVDLSFKITPRKPTDPNFDYTAGTGLPVENDIHAEFDWIFNTVCGQSNNRYVLYDEISSTSLQGTIGSLTISRKDDGPNEYHGSLTFKIGVVEGASN